MKQFIFLVIMCLNSLMTSAQVFFMDYDFIKKNKIDNVLIKKEKNGEECNHQYFSFDFLEMYEEDLLTYSFYFNRSSVSKEVYIEKDYITLVYSHDVINRSYILSLDDSISEIRKAMRYEYNFFSERLYSFDYFKIRYVEGKIDTVKSSKNDEEITEVYYYENPNADLITRIDVFSNSVYVYSYNFYYNTNNDAQVNSVIKKIDSLEIVLRKQSKIINENGSYSDGHGGWFKTKVLNIEAPKKICIPYLKVNVNDFSDEEEFKIRHNTSYVDIEEGYFDAFYFGFNFCLVNHGDFVFNLPKQKIIETRVINRERILDYENKEGSFEYRLSKDELLITKHGVNSNNMIERSSFLFASEDDYIKSLGGYTNLKTVIEEVKDNKTVQKVEKKYKIYNSID